VTHVWVDGELLLDNRVLTTMDLEAIRAESATWGERFRVH
jgi:hypothetical protein